jgi:tRNA pseudouridine13 synthase
VSADDLLRRWRSTALELPRALGPPVGAATLRATPEDFVVEEDLGFAPDGGSAHRLLWVEKRGANTLWVAREFARRAGVRPDDVGFAGLKDRHALTRQWFSIPATPRVPAAGDAGEGFRVLAVLPHSRKLRRGALAGNLFALRLTDFDGDRAALERRIGVIATRGVPNGFGPQRFGRDGRNLDEVAQRLATGRLPGGREARAFVFSAARALLFNGVLAARIRDGSWERLLPGELVNLDGSGSFFCAPEPDDALLARLAAGDVHPTGPLPGRIGRAPAGAALGLEAAALAADADLVAALEAAGLEAERRALRLWPSGLRLDGDATAPVVHFRLPRGAYATSVLHAMIDCRGEVPEET